MEPPEPPDRGVLLYQMWTYDTQEKNVLLLKFRLDLVLLRFL